MPGLTATARIEGHRVSLHQRILSEIEDRILSGAWMPGHRIPPEHELAGLYGCSRMTVNKVLTQLTQAGLIERRRKAGSFVRRPHSQSAVLEIKDIRAEVLERGQTYGFEAIALHRRRTRHADVQRLALTDRGRVVDVTCRHLAGRRPFCLEERLINLAAVPEAARESFTAIAPGAWLLLRVPWTAAEHRIRAVAANPQIAALLSVAEGTACLVVERRTWAADRPVTSVRLTYPGDAHDLIARFVPRKHDDAGPR